jgi:hypothetical protein
VIVEIKEQSKQWLLIHSPDKPKRYKHMLSACQKVDGGIYVIRDHDNVRTVFRRAKGTA